ncbi:hypothetical protein WA026_013250 [Henosepilachna vigintioctopunctata]|uniref:Glycosyl transferase family 25 domain-containing protein n=1 Tax=Henosepilachna vigintioctopunctata TaxID=420089 RepID=A0AAW1UB13_9CUCU
MVIMKLLPVILLFYLFNSVIAVNKNPTVFISILARNKAHTLPYFLSYLQNLRYPKERLSLWIQSDHNSDNTIEILKVWISSVQHLYHSIITDFDEKPNLYVGEDGPGHWTEERFRNVIDMRESALNHARKIWADYYWTIDCDVFLTNPDTLNYMISKDYVVVAPMLKSGELYSNFWYGMTSDYYYYRTEEYKPILYRENKGCFDVPMIHSCVLINLKTIESDYLTYVPTKIPNFDGPTDDIIAFAISANRSGISLHVCNEDEFGFITTPLEKDDNISIDEEQVISIKLDILTIEDEINVVEPLKKELNETSLKSLSFMPDFVDPYHKRPMTLGEIGCFLSHFNIWKEIVAKKYKTSLILEDDIRFEPYFRMKVHNLMNEINVRPDWDLIYFGRKRLQESSEPWVKGAHMLVEAGYSYWTLGYALSLQGAHKLLDGDPLSRLVPVDEYIPILFDKHPQSNYKEYFPRRDLVALSAAPLLLYPIHYTGETGYISDTEDSKIIHRHEKEDL